jgi:aminoglycoside/choline kinase family phosphotransferase
VVAAATIPEAQGVAAAVDQLGWDLASTTVSTFPARGSDRSFARIRCGRERAVIIRYGDARPENARYVAHARFLAEIGVRVPRIRLDMPDLSMVVVEDLGDRVLCECAGALSRRALQRVYGKILDAMMRLHTEGTRLAKRRRLVFEPAFTPGLYRWEHDLFVHHFLEQRLRMSAPEVAGVRRVLERIARRLNRVPRVLIHRDLQSENVMLVRGGPALIDFQGMRFGPALYDLASLVCDPYAVLPAAFQKALIRRYAALCGGTQAAVEARFWPAAVQRLTQALGAFARLAAVPGTERFERCIVPGLAMLTRALSQVDKTEAMSHVLEKALRQEAPS